MARAKRKKDMKWYVLHVETGKETRVRTEIKRWAIRKQLDHLIGRILIPLKQTPGHRPDGKPITINQKRYPGYLIVNAVHNPDTFLLIDGTKFVFGYLPHKVVTDDDEENTTPMPTPLDSEEAAQEILNSVRQAAEPERVIPPFKVGDTVVGNQGLINELKVEVMGISWEDPKCPIVEIEYQIIQRPLKTRVPYYHLKAAR